MVQSCQVKAAPVLQLAEGHVIPVVLQTRGRTRERCGAGLLLSVFGDTEEGKKAAYGSRAGTQKGPALKTEL